MKIDNVSPLTQPNSVTQGKQNEKADAGREAGDSPSAEVSRLRAGGADQAQDIDQAKVDEMRQAIAEGRLEIRADKIADGLIDSVRDLLDRS